MGRKLTSQTFHFLNSNKFPHISVTGRNQKTEGLCTDVGVFSSGCQVNTLWCVFKVIKTSFKKKNKKKTGMTHSRDKVMDEQETHDGILRHQSY